MAPTNAESLLKAIEATIDPVRACNTLYECIQRLTSQLVGLLGQDGNFYNFRIILNSYAVCNNITNGHDSSVNILSWIKLLLHDATCGLSCDNYSIVRSIIACNKGIL